MKNKIKSVLIPLVLLAVICLLCACGRGNSQFVKNDKAGYTVSVRFDANGGEFTTSCGEIVDSFNISGMATNSKGMVELALIAPDNSIRGNNDTYTVLKNGYFLAGWYANRTENVDAQGNVTYSYSNKWDFETGRLEVDPSKDYTSAEPVLTLYAVWVPAFTINFYNMNTGELMDSDVYNPSDNTVYQVPNWVDGKMEMYDFPKLSGSTFVGAYYDAEGTMPIEGTMTHTGSVDPVTGEAIDPVMNVYIDWMEGEWFRIETAAQLAKNLKSNGCYEILADLDFTDVTWPTSISAKEFKGTIIGNGHTISNVNVVQTDNSWTSFGLFGAIGANAKMEDIHFENITAVIQKGIRATGASYGLFAGTINANAQITNVTVTNGQLQIDSAAAFLTSDYVIGLYFGTGTHSGIVFEEIEAVAVGQNPENVQITVDETTGELTVIME